MRDRSQTLGRVRVASGMEIETAPVHEAVPENDEHSEGEIELSHNMISIIVIVT